MKSILRNMVVALLGVTLAADNAGAVQATAPISADNGVITCTTCTTASSPTNYGVAVGGSSQALGFVGPDSSSTKFLRSNGSSANPSFEAITAGNITGTMSLASGGTGTSLSDPNADRILFWDDGEGAVAFLADGSGISISTTTLNIDLLSSQLNTGSTTSSYSGLEIAGSSSQLSLLQGCSDGEILKWEEDDDTWKCASDNNSGGGGGGQLTEEEVEDYVGGMLGGTETGITVTYQDGTNDIDFVVSDLTVAGDSGSTGMTPGDTLTVAGSGTVSTEMSGDTLTVTGSAHTAPGGSNGEIQYRQNGTSFAGTSQLTYDGTNFSYTITSGDELAASKTFKEVRNESGATIYKCAAVYVSGYDISANLPLVSVADSDDSAKMPAIGLLNEDLANNSNGFVISGGTVSGLDSSTSESWSEGDSLYVNATGTSASEDCGETLTSTRPTGASTRIQSMGFVTRVNPSQGRILVNNAGRTNDVPNIASGNIWVGNSNGIATSTSVSGDIAITNTGVTSVQANSVALSTDTTGNYVASATSNGGLALTGTEGGSLGIAYSNVPDDTNNGATDDSIMVLDADDSNALKRITLAELDTLIDTDTDTQLTEEQVEDFVGGMLGGTETGITVTYQDGTNDIDFVVADLTVAGDSGSTAMTPGDTLTVAGSGSVSTAMSGDTLTITGTDNNTTYSAGDGLDLSSTTFSTDLKSGSGLVITSTELDIDTAVIQARVSGTCSAGNSIRAIAADGTVTCEEDTDTNTNQLTTFTLTADSGSNQTIEQGSTFDIAGGTNATTVVGANDTVTINVDDAFVVNSGDDTMAGTLTAKGVTLSDGATGPGLVKILEDTDLGSNFTSITVGDMVSDAAYTLPTALPDANKILQSTDAGVLSWVADTDTNTTYSAGDGLELTDTTFSTDLRSGSGLIITSTELDVDTAVIQARVSGTCSAGNSIREIAANGLVTCEADTDTNTNQLTTFTLTADSGSDQTIEQGSTFDIAGGTNATTVVSATDTVTINVDDAFLKNDAADVLDVETSATNSVTDVLTLQSQSSGTPANNIGVGVALGIETAAGNVETGARIAAVATDVDPTNEDVDLVFYTMLSGDAANEALRVHDDGTVTASTFAGALSGNASTATALEANPTDCSSNQFANAIVASGNLTCAAIADADVPNDITVDLASVATAVTISDNESTDESNAIIFTPSGDLDGGNLALESDGDLTYNPSTGAVTATTFVGALTGEAQTAAALATNPANCSTATEFAVGITAAGVAECEAISDADVPDTITASNYLLLSGGTLTGNLVIPNSGNIGSVGDTDAIAIGSAGRVTVSTDLWVGDDIVLDSDQAVIKFGDDQEITLTHDADDGLRLKNALTADDSTIQLTLQTGETDIVSTDVIGAIKFQAPNEATGGDSQLVAAGIEAVAEDTFDATKNKTKLSFKTGASETATEKMSLSSGGNLTVSGDLTISGDDLVMATNTDTYILVADDTSFNPVAMSGDVAIANDGATTIQANSVALGTDTNGDYVATITAGTGLTSTGGTSGEGVAHSLSVDAAQSGITSVGTLTGLTVSNDVTIRDAVNDGNPVLALGAAAAEQLTITSAYDSGGQTLDYVEFATATADDSTSDEGRIIFDVDGADILTIDDGGLSLSASLGLDVNGTSILSDSGGTMTLNNIDALGSTTESTIETAIDTLANLTSFGAADATTNIVAGDVTMYNDANDGNPTISLGSSSAERLAITANYASGGKTVDSIEFSTAVASGDADKGKIIFDIDGIDIATIDDGGIDLVSGKSFTVNGSAVGGAALTGSTDNTIVTVTGADAIEGEANLTFDGSDLSVAATNSKVIVKSTGDTNNTSEIQILADNDADATDGWAIKNNANGTLEFNNDANSAGTFDHTILTLTGHNTEASSDVKAAGTVTVGGNIIKASDGGSTITMDTSDNVTIGGTLEVDGNIIKASDGGSTITMDTGDNVTVAGGLTTGCTPGSGDCGITLTDNTANPSDPGSGKTMLHTKDGSLYVYHDGDTTPGVKVATEYTMHMYEDNLGINANFYTAPIGFAVGSGTASAERIPAPETITITKIACAINAAFASSGSGRTVYFEDNGTDDNTCKIEFLTGNTTGSDTCNTVVTAGHTMTLHWDETGAASGQGATCTTYYKIGG